MADEITFTGRINNIAYFSDDSSWGAVDIVSETDIPHSREKFDFDLDSNQMKKLYSIRVVGKMVKPHINANVTITGIYSYNQKYKSDQYEITDIYHNQPKTIDENQAYLRSIITDRQSDSLLSVYPNIVQEIIDGKDSVDLSLLSGIGQATYDKIRDKVVENFAISDILSLLIPLGVSFSKVSKLMDGEKNPTILKEKILNDPYSITSIDGISFKTADKIAIRLNPGLKKSEKRLVAFIRHHLSDIAENQGHTYVTIEELKTDIVKDITECDEYFNEWVEKERSETDRKKRILHIEDDKVGLKGHWYNESFIWNKIIELSNSEPLRITQENIDEGIKIAESQLGFQLTPEQRDVVVNMTKSNFSLLSGKSGTGKTTTARALLNIYKHAGYSVTVAAFSAKASRRATEATGIQGATLHKLLGIGTETEGSPIPYKILFADENSMNPLFLMRKIFELVGMKDIKIILCGDNKQINPIGVGNVFSDLLEKDYFNKNVLTKIQRQAADSGIITDGNLIRESIDPIEVKEPKIVHGVNRDLIYVFRNDKEEIFRIAVSSYLKSVREKGIGNTVLLVPFKTKGLNCTKEFNKVIQRELNSENQNIKFKHGENEFWMNDFVIHCKNNYEKFVMNGSMGFVVEVESNRLVVDYDGQLVEYNHDDIGELNLGYSITAHKFQGSESLDCIVVIDSSHWILLSNAWLYTAMTRARQRCLIISDTTAYNRCMIEDKSKRNTWMKDMEII